MVVNGKGMETLFRHKSKRHKNLVAASTTSRKMHFLLYKVKYTLEMGTILLFLEPRPTTRNYLYQVIVKAKPPDSKLMCIISDGK